MEEAMEDIKFKLDALRFRNASFCTPLKNKPEVNESLIKEMDKNIEDENLAYCKENLPDLNDNTTNLIDMMIKQNSITEDILLLTDKLLKKLENKDTLSGYRDWISYFISAIQRKLDANTWSIVQFAVQRKVKKNKVDYADSEKGSILLLDKVLEDVNMKLCDYEMLILMKHKSNEEFYGDTSETQEQAEAKLQASFAEEMKIFKEPLQKLFRALSIWDADA